MDWENLRHFRAFAAHGSLSGAARALGVEHATIARRIGALERHLKIRLVDRRGRRLTLTADGERIAAIAGRMEIDADAIGRAAAGASNALSGDVTISAPPAFAAARLVEPLAALQRRHPMLELRLIGETRSAVLERREADVAIRLSRPEQGDLTITRIGEMPFRLYAAPGYLQHTPAPEWTFIGYDAPMAVAPQQARLRETAGARRLAFLGSTAEIQHAAAKAGAGIAMLPDFMAERDDALVRVDTGAAVFRRDIWLAVHSDMKAAARIRAVIDALKAGVAESA